MNPEITSDAADSPLPESANFAPHALLQPEMAEICSALAAEGDPVKQRSYWRTLEGNSPCPKALDLALNNLMNPEATNRGEAVRYLRFCYPDRLPALLDAFSHDPDEELRYQLSEFLKDSDVEAAVGMKIGMLGKASAAKQETLVHEIAEFGNLYQLEALRGLDQLAGGSSVFARAAELLAARTTA